MICGRRGLCNCGRPECEDAEQWRRFCRIWLQVTRVERERARQADYEDEYAHEVGALP